MPSVIELLDSAILQAREDEYGGKTKTSFWASESETMAFDIFHRWMNTPVTNPITEEKLMMLKMRKLTEEAIVGYLRKSGKLIEKFSNDDRVYFEWGPNKVPISGYPDAGLLFGNEEALVEVKTYYGSHQHSEIRIGKIKPAYMKQLAIYMHHYGIKHGILLMVNQGTGERFEFDIYPYEDKEYQYICPDNEMVVSLLDTFKRWEKIYVENILPKKEPKPEFIYKHDIEKLDWSKQSSSSISKARMNKAVIGDWQVTYSDFKNLIIERQGTCLGYSPDELKRIRELTDGYSTKRSATVRFDPDEIE